MKHLGIIIGMIALLMLTFTFEPNTMVEARTSCHDDGTCFDLCGYSGTTACSYALCDDDIGTELCMSGGEAPPPCEEWHPCLE